MLASCGTVYCNRSCLWVCDSGQTVIACINLHQTGSLGAGSDHLQLIKFWRSCGPRKGSAAGRNFLAPCYYRQHAVFVSLGRFFIYYFVIVKIFVEVATV